MHLYRAWKPGFPRPPGRHAGLGQSRYFLEVARTQRASAAARKLGVEHTTVSRRIRALEAELDTLLFEKSRGAASC